MRRLSHHIRHDVWRDRPTGGVADFLHRIDLAADALDGKAVAFHSLLEGELTALDTPKLASDGFGKSYGDRLFVLGVEYGHTRQADKAIACLSRAVEQSSLYLPWALPYGASPMPRDVTRRAAYASIWRRSPQIVELIKRRKSSGGWGW